MKITEIPIYLEAKTKNELINEMLKNNQKNNKHYQYKTPMKDGDKWVVWYYEDAAKLVRKKLNGNGTN